MVRLLVFVLLPGCLLAGCDDAAAGESLLERLQIVTIVAQTPELAPGQSTDLTVWTADPDGVGVDLLVWSCTLLGEGCFEAAFPLSTWVRPTDVLDGFGATSLAVPGEVGEIVPQGLVIPTSVWALACEPGLCPVIDAARDGTVDPALLGDPEALMRDLPIEGTSLVRRSVSLSWSDEPNRNPAITAAPPSGAVDVSPGQTEDLALVVSDSTDVVADAYTTCGAMSPPRWNGHDLAFSWTAPADAGKCDLWIVLEDGLGGSAVWHGVRDVR